MAKKVFVGMSGGVDSSVAAALLKKQGYDVVGIHLKCFNVDGCAKDDAEDARRAAEHLGIPFYTFDYEQEYKDRVVEYMVAGYKKGITPNPDVMCNREIKFGLFYKKAMELGADYVATGHYVRLANSQKGIGYRAKNQKSLNPIGYTLLAARDKNKDQSYFLWALKPEQLKHCLFPIGDYKKPQVRKLAEKFGLHNATKKDSQGICFLGRVRLDDFLSKYIKKKIGQVRLANTNEIIGQHSGAHFYTIGQRSGLGIGGSQKPLYIAEKDVKKNIITVAEGESHPALYKKEVELSDVNFLTPVIANPHLRVKQSHVDVFARVRYRQPLEKAELLIRNSKFVIRFKKPVKFVAPGQSAVFYDFGGILLGGGVIR